MSFICRTLFSGSAGNSLLVGYNGTYILIDAGKNSKAITDTLSRMSVSPSDISAIFISHEHSDHIGALDVFARRNRIPVFANEATANMISAYCRKLPDMLIHKLGYYDTARKNGISVTPYPVPHDSVACSGFIIEADGKRLVTATDMGELTGDFASAAKDADAILIESNYDKTMLQNCRYPEELKRRIASKYGHLSNDDCAEAVAVLAKHKTKKFILGHISEESNTPDTAYKASYHSLTEAGAKVTNDVENRSSDLLLITAGRYSEGPEIEI